MRRALLTRVTRVAVPAAVALVVVTGALAYWTTTGTGIASGSVGALAAPTISSSTPGAGTVTLSWTAVTPPGSGTVSYYVSRDGGEPGGSCPSSSSPSTVTSCTDSGVSVGTHEYTVTAVWNSWTATSTTKSVQVTFGPATHFLLTAATTTPTAGAADNLTITAKDASNNTVATYAGSHNLTFGGAASIGSFTPTVTSSSGTATSFGTETAIIFTNGVASVSSGNNGVMKLYKVETAAITVSDGTINNGTGLSVSVGSAAAASFSLEAASTTPSAGAADNLTITALDAYGNTATTYAGSHNLTFGGAATIGTFHPTVTKSTGAATNFGTATAIVFTNGVATTSGSSNGVMTLYKAETAKITVSSGTVNNGSGLAVTVSEGPTAGLSLAAAAATAGAADNLTITAQDAYGNTATTYAGSHNLTFGGAASIGSFTPTVTSSAGTVTSFGTETAISFTNGVASVSGANNGVMTLYKVETAKITVSDGTINNGTGLSVTVSVASAASLSLAAVTTTPTAGAADNLTITAKDAYGNTATTYAGSHSLTFGGAATIGSFTPTVTSSAGTVTNFGTETAINFTNGVASVSGANNGVMKLYKVEAANITVSDGTINNGSGLAVSVGSAAAASFSLTAASTTPAAGAADNLTITALDAYGNTATTYTGSHSLTFGGASTIGTNHPTVTNSLGTATNFGSGTAIIFTNGVASVSSGSNGVMKLYKAEAAKITVSIGSINNGSGLAVTVSEGPAASLSLAAASTTPTAGAADNLTITAQDAYGNTATTYAGSHSLTFGGAATIGSFTPTVTSSSGTATNFGAATAINFTSGVASVSGANNGVMALYKVETAKITVSDGSINNGAGLSVTVSVASAASLSLAAASTTPTAGAADNLTITAKDAYGNTATTYAGSHTLTFGGAATIGSFTPTVTSSSGTATNFGAATAINFTSGVASVSSGSNGVMKLYKVEAANITVSDGSINNGSGLAVSVGSAAATSFSLAAASTTPTAGAADNLTITALDAYGNTATTYAGSHTLTFGGAATIGTNHPKVTNSSGTATNFGSGTAISFTNGVASVSGANNGVMTLYKVETANITVSEGTINNGSGLSVTVSEGPAANLSLAAATTTPAAAAADNLTITAQDAYGNTATTYTGSHNLTFGGAASIGSFTPTVTSSAGTVTSFGTETAISFTNGVASVSGANNGVMTLYKVETAKITVSDGTINNGTGLSVTVSPGPAASLSLAAVTTTPTAGAADNLTITAKDAYGNTATTYAGSHSLTFGGAATIGSFTPTVTSSAGTVTNFGTETAINFTNGVASVSGANNGVMKLYKAEAANITVSDGTISNGAGLSVSVGSAAVASLSLAAATTTPTAGAADNLTITASDTYGNGYTGSQNLTFGGAATIGTYHPTVTNSSGTATNFGTATAISFTSGVASVSSGNNGVMTLYKVETTKITVSDGAINNGTGLSVTVGVASAASLSLAAASTTPTAGAADNLTITAKDAYGNTATTYTGSHSLTFGGANSGPNGNPPTVTSSSGTATNFGTATAISFTSGVASVSGANNGVMKLYKVEAASITVSDGTINNGAGLAVTVKAGAAAQLAWTHVVVSSGTLSSPCLFTCTVTALGNSGTFTANVSVTDSSGNTVTNLGTGHTVSVTNVGGSISGGSLTISSTEAAESTTQFTFTAQNGSWTSDSLTAQTSGGTSYTSATATVTQN